MKTKLTIFFIFVMATIGFGQNEPLTIKSQNISIGLIGAPVWPIGITYGQMLSDRISFEIGVGALASGAMLNYYITNPRQRRLNFYTGVAGMMNYDGYPMLYVPVGTSYFGKKNFQYGADIGVMISENVSPNPSFWFGAKVGYRFGADISTIKTEAATDRKNIVSGTIGFADPLIGVVYERLITPSFGAEVKLGVLGASLGGKYYFTPVAPGRANFHAGISESWGFFVLVGSTGFKTFVPIGVSYLTTGNFRYNIEAGPQMWHDEATDILLGINLSVGYAF